ncbi:MAG: TldD/PmbA family protein [Cyanobacteria bacterium P01_E01_bin.6]
MVLDSSYSDSLPEQLLEIAHKSGAEAAEVLVSESSARPIFFEANRLKQLESNQSEGIALRIWRDHRPGLAVAYGDISPQALVDRAIALTELNEQESVELASSVATDYPDLGQKVDIETLIDWGNNAIDLIRNYCPEVLCSAEWECEAETTRLINSNGLDSSYTDTTLSCYISAELIRGDDFLSVSDGQTQRLTLDPVHVANQIIQRLEWSEKNIVPQQGHVPILFTSKAADMLWGTVQSALNGKRVSEQASPWSDRVGELVTAKELTFSQKPSEGPFSCPFDDEGTPTKRIIFVDKGELQLFYTDMTTGRSLGSGTTGNGFRPGLGSYPTPGLFNFLIEPGSRSLDDLIASLDHGIIIDQILGGGAGISGDFSVNVDLGFRVQNGNVLGRVKDTMISGNVYNALKQLIQLGNDAEWNGACYTPSIIVDGLSVIGRS